MTGDLKQQGHKNRRRRRRWYVGAALVAAGVAASALAGCRHGGGAGSAGVGPAGERLGTSPGEASRNASALPRNGPVTILTDIATVSAVLPPGRYATVFRCGCEIAAIDWAPDGKRLAYGAVTVSTWSPSNGIHVLNLATGNDRFLARNTFLSGLDWSADGRRIAYVDDPMGGGPGTIKVMDARTARLERIVETSTEGADSSPSWSPGGDRLAFASLEDGVSTISVIDLKGLRTLLARGASAPAWSPRGGEIAYRSHCGIKLVTPTGRDVTPRLGRRCRAIGVVGTPFWSPDGREIGIQTRHGIYEMNPDGSGLGLVTTGSGFGAFSAGRPSWRPKSRSPGA